jgi:hypothetical protein
MSSTEGASCPVVRYYEARCRVEPYSEPITIVVVARSWDEVVKKYPGARQIAVLEERESLG